MRHAARGRSHLLLLAALVVAPGPRARAAEEQDKFEEQTVARCAERALKAAKGERAQFLRELEAAFPEKVVNALTEEEYATWFALLAGKNEDWRRDDAHPGLAELFDKVVQRLELGPVPSIKRDEFAKYARRVLREQNPADPGADPHADADKVFRALDRNGDGELAPEEFTAGLKDDKVRGGADADGNGRITKDEYRGYFRHRVQAKAEALSSTAKPGGDPLARGGKPGAANGLPAWFTTLDTDKDGQIALFEWRKGGRPIATFTEMDLNGDGLLTRDEYLRYVKLNEQKLKQEQREEKAKDEK